MHINIGNWSGHIYIRLDGSNEDLYAYRNEETYDRLKDHVMNIIHSFKNRIETTIRGEVEGIPMAGGEPEIIAKRDSTEKKKILDKDIVIVPHSKLRDPGCCSSSEDESDSNSESENEGEVNDDKNDESGLRPLHISLSRPFYMQHQSIEPFISDMRERVRIQQQHPLSFSISARVSKCEILTNDEKTRSFLTVPLTSDKHAGSGSTAMIQKLVTIVDGTLLKFGHKGYYPDPKFHISIASWAYDERLVDMSLRLNELPPDNDDDDDDNDKVHDFSFCISGIHCIFGNAEEHHIPFGC